MNIKMVSLSVLAAMIFSSCLTRSNVDPVDSAAAKVAVTKALDAHWSAVKAKDANAVLNLLTDDVLCCGSDSREFWSKADMVNNIRQAFADTSAMPDIIIDRREIRISGDGNSAIALEQYFMKPFSRQIPFRNIYHLVKAGDEWKFDFTSVSLIPDNEDLPRLFSALE